VRGGTEFAGDAVAPSWGISCKKVSGLLE